MKEVRLNTRKKNTDLVAIVDDSDFEKVSALKWSLSHNNRYAVTLISGKLVLMHRYLMGDEASIIDHRNGNGLDNRRENIRPCSRSENAINSKMRVNNKSGFKGVSWDGRTQRWRVSIRANMKTHWLGRFNSIEEAVLRYKEAAKVIHGDFIFNQ